MSYNGTVRCGHCHAVGHNRLGCPERKRNAIENPDSYDARQWRREQAAYKDRAQNRVCSYCKKPGHNRRGCKVLKEDQALIVERQKKYLDEFAEHASSVGFLPGALVKVPQGYRDDDGGYFSKGLVALVTGFVWDDIDFLMKDAPMQDNWNIRSRNVAYARVVQTFGYTEENTGWRGAPKHNEVIHLSAETLNEILAPVLHPVAENHLSYYAQVGMLSRAHGAVAPGPTSHSRAYEPYPKGMTRHLNDRFRIKPPYNADSYGKERLCMSQVEWSNLRPEEQREHIEKYQR